MKIKQLIKALKKALCRTDDILMEVSLLDEGVKRAKKMIQARNEIENMLKVLELYK
jgi:hypothetical protein